MTRSDEELELEGMAEGNAKVRLGVTPGELARMSDSDLSLWQSGYTAGSAQFILAEKEWNYRLMSRQLHEQFALDKRLADAAAKANRFAAYLAVAATIIGAIIGAAATLTTNMLQQAQLPAAPQTSQSGTGSAKDSVFPVDKPASRTPSPVTTNEKAL